MIVSTAMWVAYSFVIIIVNHGILDTLGETRIFKNIFMEDCIIWNGRLWSQGRYGMTTRNGKSIGAHRATWIDFYGDIPKGLVVCHKCDNGLCVNINHLFLGTMKDNMQDCSAKGRLNTSCQKGQNNGNAKRSREEYVLIQKDRELGLTYSQIRGKYKIKSNGHLRKILTHIIE